MRILINMHFLILIALNQTLYVIVLMSWNEFEKFNIMFLYINNVTMLLCFSHIYFFNTI